MPASTMTATWSRRVFAGLLLVIGAVLAGGGSVLAIAGGSFYYLLTGIVVIASSILVWRSDRRGVWLFGLMLVATLAWSISEVGFVPWELVPRLVAPFVLALGFFLPGVRNAPRHAPVSRRIGGWPTFAAGLVAAFIVGAGVDAVGPTRPADPLWQTGGPVPVPGKLATPLASIPNGEWGAYGNDQGGTRFSPLDQINAGNVASLKVAWQADTGGAPNGAASTGGMEVTPIMVGDSLFICNGYDNVVSYDAETGKERWRFAMTNSASGKPCRAVTYYRVPGATGACAERIYAASQVPDLVALDARTGALCTGFGKGGRASLKAGMTGAPFGVYYVSSAPQLIRGKLVVGGGILDNQFWGAPSGVIRAFDAVTGQLAWAFDVGHPDRTMAPPPGQGYTPSTPNSWAPMSADEKLGLVYMPMGGSTPDLYGAQRRPFDEANGASVIALDAETGKMRWRFQTVHHDLWDYDVPAQPTLVDMPTPTGAVPALIQPTKRGEIFVLDRRTGQPIKPVREIQVPRGGGPGDRPSPTQPFSAGMPAFRGRNLREADMWGLTPIDQMVCRIMFRHSDYQGPFTLIGLDRPTIVQPGYVGGIDHGAISVDADRGIMIVPATNLPTRAQLLTRAEANKRGLKLEAVHGAVNSMNPMMNTPYGAANGPFTSFLGVPCTPPAYATMNAVDLATGRVIWTRPFGTAADTGPLGIHSHLPITMGVPFSGGAITTRGGLTFIAASVEQAIRAYDVRTGAELWKARLPAGGQATPMTYRAPRSGRQMVVIATGGKPSLKTTHGAMLVAYALPSATR